MGEVRRVVKNGHSQGINIPLKFWRALELAPGDAVMIELVDHAIVLSRAVSSRPLWSKEAQAKGRTHE
jgi:antitoxin component of MazEF toxin-antitoxin module